MEIDFAIRHLQSK